MALPWARAIVIGASSGIGAALARRLAREGCRLALVARREGALSALAREIGGVAEPPRTLFYPHDVARAAEIPALFQRICRDLGGLDLVIYSAGVMPRLAANEYTFEKDRQIIEVNVLGAMAWLNEAAQRFARAEGGTIVGISSVSGDRGRRGQPAYCASKAALDAYLESLRNRLRVLGVAVVTIKPGPVDTPMTEGLERRPLLISADEAARAILEAARHGAGTAYVPGTWRPIMFALRQIPSFVFSRLDI
jgi:NAD(P)-dependent dehydrogenase (short-subunit alcohol dehydrogenase family)